MRSLPDGGNPCSTSERGPAGLLLDFLAQGIDIDGVDNAPDMLERLHAKAAAAGLDVDGRVHLGRMQTLRLTRRFGTIIVPSSSFQLLLEPDDAAEAMRRFFALLLPGGSLAMPFIVMDKPYDEEWTRDAILEDGMRVKRTARATFDPAIGIEATDDTYEVFNNGDLLRTERFVRPRATRAYSRDQARQALRDGRLRRPRVGRRLHVRGPRADRGVHDHRPPPGVAGPAQVLSPRARRRGSVRSR